MPLLCSWLQDWEANEEEDISYDLDDGLTAQQRARLSLARQAQDDDVEVRGYFRSCVGG